MYLESAEQDRAADGEATGQIQVRSLSSSPNPAPTCSVFLDKSLSLFEL